MESNEEVLGLIFRINEDLLYEVSDQQLVTILIKQEHWIQRALRKLGISIPKYKRITFDAYASFVFLQIDGVKTVEDIGKLLEEKYAEASEYLYERLLLFLNHIEVNDSYIHATNK